VKIAPNTNIHEQSDFHGRPPPEKIIASRPKFALLIVFVIAALLIFQTRPNPSPPHPDSREKADEVFGQAALAAATAGDYDTTDDFLNYVASDAICDDYSEIAPSSS
jgi:hypothetical protein